MTDRVGIAASAVTVFTGTNVDDIVVLTVLFVTSRTTGRPRAWQIVIGQYAGIGVLVAASLAVAAGLLVVPDPWTGLLGLLPVALGVRALLTRHGADGTTTVVTGALGVAGVTIANGADNIAVYVPVFRALAPAEAGSYLLIFVGLIALWCAVAAWLGRHPRVIRAVEQVGHWLVPVVFIGIGLVILVGSGVLGRLASLARLP